VRLAAMVRLVIEKMIERRSKRLLDILRIDNGAVSDRLREVGLAQGAYVPSNAFIFVPAGRTQLVEIVIEDRVQARRDFTLAGEAPHPDTIADQKMIERAVQRLEENTTIGTIVGIADPCARVK
jgi:hypothetical protein